MPSPPAEAAGKGLPWMLNTPMPPNEQREHLRKVLEHQQTLRTLLVKVVTSSTEECQTDPNNAQRLHAAQHAVDGLGAFCSAFLGTIFYNERGVSFSSAMSAFGIAELLELIL